MRILSVTAVKDEGPFLLEWLAWHRMIGVTDFILLSNDCRDGTDGLLDTLEGHGILRHVRNPAAPGKSLQWQALKAAWQHPLRKDADWMLISDVDEFPVIHTGAGRIADLMAAVPDGTDAIALGWRLFGHGGIIGFADRPVTAQFLHSAPPDMLHPVAATYFKSLFRPAAFRQPGVHRPVRAVGAAPLWVDGSGTPLPDHIAAEDKRLSLIPVQGQRALAEMHHYSLRALESFVVKAERGLPNHSTRPVDLAYWVERNFNTQRNEAALALQPALEVEIAELKGLPGVAALHDAACDWHRAAFAGLITQPGPYRLFADCLHVSSAAVLPERLAVRLLQMFQRVGPAGGL